jgi:hypothetical protein
VYNGQINCEVDICPDDCEVCKFCLYYVVDCHSHAPSSTPSSKPSKLLSALPSLSPSIQNFSGSSAMPSSVVSSPTALRPTFSPSNHPTVIPSIFSTNTPSLSHSLQPSMSPSSLLFDISNCQSYSNRWYVRLKMIQYCSSYICILHSHLHFYFVRFLDLAQSCDRSPTGELINCQCFEAQQLIDDGKINCETDRCPPECEVCSFCLVDVLKTDCLTQAPSSAPSSSPSFSAFDINDCASYSNVW